MIYIELFVEFLKIGLFSFGGAYGAIPIIQDVVLQKEWMDHDMFYNMIAISESTPGPIMVNAATYIGNMQAGFFGALVATLGVVLPAFVIILLIIALFQKLLKNEKVQMILKGIESCIMGIIIATGMYMLISGILVIDEKHFIDYNSLIILMILIIVSIAYFKKKRKTTSPIALIIISAVFGGILF